MEYEIKTIGDLLKIPADRRAACLAEILNGCAAVEAYSAEVRRHAPRWLRGVIVPRLSRFTWVDDGKTDGEGHDSGGRVVFRTD